MYQLYLVTDSEATQGRDFISIVLDAVKGGVTMVQLREKKATTRHFVELGTALHQALQPLGIPLIVNDRVDIALAIRAEGVHIGQSDMPYAMVREILGHDKIVGLSVENMQQVVEANQLDVDYIGISPVFATPTKTDTAQPFGLDGLRQAVAISQHPTVAIGGINIHTAAEVMKCGTDGIAVVSAIMSNDNPQQAARQLRNCIRQ